MSTNGDDPIPLRPPSADEQTASDTLEPEPNGPPPERYAGIGLNDTGGFQMRVDKRLTAFEVIGMGETLADFGREMLAAQVMAANEPSPIVRAGSIPQDHLGPNGKRRN